MNPHAARGRPAASLRLLAAPLLDAQRRAWESGDHPGILFAGAVISSLINAAAGRAHLDGGDGRPSVVMNDGEQLRHLPSDAPRRAWAASAVRGVPGKVPNPDGATAERIVFLAPYPADLRIAGFPGQDLAREPGNRVLRWHLPLADRRRCGPLRPFTGTCVHDQTLRSRHRQAPGRPSHGRLDQPVASRGQPSSRARPRPDEPYRLCAGHVAIPRSALRC